jgi:hypothetical protein
VRDNLGDVRVGDARQARAIAIARPARSLRSDWRGKAEQQSEHSKPAKHRPAPSESRIPNPGLYALE